MRIGFICMAALGLSACGPLAPYSEEREAARQGVSQTETEETSEPEVPKPSGPQQQIRRADIDWNAARSDFAAAQAQKPDAMAVVASGPNAPPVPVILPQMAGIASNDGGLEFRPLGDGYFALVRGETYDMLINGTDRLSPKPPGADPIPENAFRFEETMTGAQVSFKRYGASYLVEFACKDPATTLSG
ncbi:MAG: hypothetical protein AAGF20_00505, partial [Pseudomonadota bacterium]